MGREEWLLSQSIEAELDLASNALVRVDDLKREATSRSAVDPDDDRLELAQDALISHVERAMRSIGALAERLGVRSIEREMSLARSDRTTLADTTREYEGEIFSKPLAQAVACFAPLRLMADVRAITAQGVLRNLLENTAVIMADQGISPTNEADVRNAVLKVCNYSFPDAAKEIGIPQILKHSRGDLGVRALRTMVEFKFVNTKDEMKIALEGVHADMMGYRHPDWDTFYGVFYMTGPYYIQADVQRQFEFIAADRSWTPIVVQGNGARPIRVRKPKAST